jgi:hypothetical protein
VHGVEVPPIDAHDIAALRRADSGVFPGEQVDAAAAPVIAELTRGNTLAGRGPSRRRQQFKATAIQREQVLDGDMRIVQEEGLAATLRLPDGGGAQDGGYCVA